MNRSSLASTIVAALAAAGACWTVWRAGQKNASDLPVPHPRCLRDVFPEWDLERIEIGGSEWSAYREMQVTPSQLLLFESGNGSACVRFRYDSRYLAGPAVSLVIAVDQRRVVNRWLVSGDRLPAECAALPTEDVELTGLFDAGVCYADLWAVTEIPSTVPEWGDPYLPPMMAVGKRSKASP